MALPHLQRTTSIPPRTSTMACRAVDAITNFTMRMPTCAHRTVRNDDANPVQPARAPCELRPTDAQVEEVFGESGDVDRTLGVPGLLLHHAHVVEGTLLPEALVDDVQLWDLTLGEP